MAQDLTGNPPPNLDWLKPHLTESRTKVQFGSFESTKPSARELAKASFNEFHALQTATELIEELEKYKARYLFLEQFITIDDVGDEFYVPGIVVQWEEMEEKLSLEKPDEKGSRKVLWQSHDDTVMDMVDRAIKEHGMPISGRDNESRSL